MQRQMMTAAALAIGMMVTGQVMASPCTDREHGSDSTGWGSFGAVHPNGGGWVAHKCIRWTQSHDNPNEMICALGSNLVPESVYVGPNSAVCSWTATVSGNVALHNSIVWQGQISGNAVIRNSVISRHFGGGRPTISGNARIINTFINGGTISGNAKVLDGAAVTESAHVHGSAKVAGEGTRVFGNAEVYGTAVVRNGAWIFGNAKINSGRYTNNAQINTDQTGTALDAGGLLSNPVREENTETESN